MSQPQSPGGTTPCPMCGEAKEITVYAAYKDKQIPMGVLPCPVCQPRVEQSQQETDSAVNRWLGIVGVEPVRRVTDGMGEPVVIQQPEPKESKRGPE